MALLTVLEKVTEEQKRAYIERMLEVMRKADELEGEALQRAMELTAELQERVLGRIHAALAKGADQGGKWNPFWLPRLRQAIDELAHEMAQRYGTEVGAFLPKSWMVGGELVDESLSAAAEHIGYKGAAGDLMPKVQTHEVGIAANWSPDLIQGMAQHTKDVIGKEIAASVLTGESPHVLSKRLAGQITTQGSPFNSVAYRAQLITRTETRRVQGLGAQRRMEQAVSRYPRIRMKKTLLVAEVNGWPCEECDAISKQGPWDVNDPDAPQVPIHPNCRCDMIPDVQGFDVPAPDEKPVDEERDASVSDGERVEEAGTSDGARKGWDTRGRGRKKDDTEDDFTPSSTLDLVNTTPRQLREAWHSVGERGLQLPPSAFGEAVLKGSSLRVGGLTIEVVGPGSNLNSPEGTLVVTWDIVDKSDAPAGLLDRRFEGNVAVHGLITLEDAYKGKGIGTIITRNLMQQYDAAGVTHIRIDDAGLDNGSYTWARMGFLPTKESWDEIRPRLQHHADALVKQGRIAEDDYGAIRKYLEIDSPKGIWRIADIPSGAGKILLPTVTWRGNMDLIDKSKESPRSRFENYQKKHPDKE